MGIQINGQTDTISATDGSFTISGASGDLIGNLTGNVTGNLTGTASTATAAATAYGLSGSPTLSGITSVSTTNLTVNGNTYPSAGPLSNRNLIINGAMVFDQRNSGSSVTPTANTYVLDRWHAISDASSKYSVQQVSDAPAGFSFSQKFTSLSAYTPASNELFGLWQWVEGFNSAQLEFGTASAKTITVSFWVKSSLTGTFGGGILNSGYTRGYPFEYTISSANTWEYKTVTIAGDTSGTWIGATNGQGLLLNLTFGAGSARSNTAGAWSGTTYSFSATGAVNVVSTNAATWQITGVQLEVGSVATPFEHRSYADELAKCQRYCYAAVADGSLDNYAPLANGRFYNTSDAQFNIFFPVTMRYPPTLDSATTAAGTFFYNTGGTFGGVEATTIALNERSYNSATVYAQGASGQTAGNGTTLYSHDAEVAKLIFTAEL